MHTQHVRFSAYVAWGGGVGGVVAVVLVFEEGDLSGLEEVDDDRSVLEVVVVVVFFSPSPLLFLLVLVLLLDFIDTIWTGLSFFDGSFFLSEILVAVEFYNIVWLRFLGDIGGHVPFV